MKERIHQSKLSLKSLSKGSLASEVFELQAMYDIRARGMQTVADSNVKSTKVGRRSGTKLKGKYAAEDLMINHTAYRVGLIVSQNYLHLKSQGQQRTLLDQNSILSMLQNTEDVTIV